MSTGRRLALVFVLQALVLAYMIADRQWTLASGTPVVLETLPLDPRSLFSGDYVRLNYRINRLSLDKIGGDRQFRRHDTVYVLLRAGQPYWEAVAVHARAPVSAPSAEYVMLRGEVTHVDAAQVSVRYGIESYFVPEGEGRQIERQPPQAVRVVVDARGRAALQALLYDGEERAVE